MKHYITEDQWLSTMQQLTHEQKASVLNFIKELPREMHSTRMYKAKAIRQIQQAIRQPLA